MTVVYQQEDDVHLVLDVSKCRGTGFAEFGQREKSVTINQDHNSLKNPSANTFSSRVSW